MKKTKLFKMILLTIITMSLFTGCENSNSTKISSNNSIEISDRFKRLNITFTLPNQKTSDMVIICDTKTNLLYLNSYNHDSPTPFIRRELNHNGDMVIVQYTLDDLKKEYPNENINFYK